MAKKGRESRYQSGRQTPRRPSRQRKSLQAWNALNGQIVDCERCPRLLTHCQKIAADKRAAYRDQTYWGRPVANLGDDRARLLIAGLAPAAHGANRTGRMFTGDRSGDWLFRALYKAGFASQKEATARDDGLVLTDCAITAACHCAPPDNKPTTEELQHCSDWLTQTFALLPVQVIVALGGIGWNTVWKYFRNHAADQLLPARKPKFGHGEVVQLTESMVLIGSYHPSQQNTFTGRLTEPMLDSVFRKAKRRLRS